MRARRALLDTIEQLIRARESEGMTSAGPDALSLMMRLGDTETETEGEGEGEGSKEGKRQLDRNELKDICLELLFAGHATVTSASTTLLYYLARCV